MVVERQRKIERVFRILYFGTLAMVPVVFLVSVVKNLPESVGDLQMLLLVSFVAVVFAAFPLWVIFLGLNAWGAILYPARRRRYVMIAVVLVIWLAWSIYRWNTFVHP